MKRSIVRAAFGLLVFVTGACGAGAAANDDPEPSSDSACLVGSTDCADDPTQNTDNPNTDSACLVGSTDCIDDPTADFPVEAARDRARAVLGLAQADLTDDVRIGRIGDEPLMLTEDYQLGRLTVALDDLDGDGLRVVDVTVELPDGPETYQLEAN